MSSTFRTVTIVGATGDLGSNVAEAFLNDGSYKVKILRSKPEKENKKANALASKGVEVLYANYDQESELVEAFTGTDVIVSTVSSMNIDLFDVECKLLAAAKKVGVKRFIPSEFGLEHEPGTEMLTEAKERFQKELKESGLEYTFIYTGLFQELISWLAYDVPSKTAKFYVDGNTKLASTSWADIGRYTVESLKMPEARNAHIRVAGANLTLNEYLQKFEEASGSKWNVVYDKDPQNPIEKFKAIIMEHGTYEKFDNDKFSFTPCPVTEAIKNLMSNN